jgi:chitinase
MSMSYWAWNAAPGTPLIGLTQMDYATANTTIQLAAQSFAYHGASPANELDIPVSLAAPHTAPVTIAYATQDGTAQAGTDYVAASGTISFAPGETAKIVPALLLNPAGGTGNLSFLLKLSDTAGRALGTETVTIQHDPQATVTRTSQQWSDIAYNTVTINNTSGQTINGWEVAVHTASSVLPSQVYDGQLVSASGNDYLFTSASWNQKIAPGGSAHFEFGATQTAINTPVSASVVHTGY